MFVTRLYKVLFIFLGAFPLYFSAQTAIVTGIVKGVDGEPVENVQIAVLEDADKATSSNTNGSYTLEVPAGKQITIAFYNLSFTQFNKKVFLKDV